MLPSQVQEILRLSDVSSVNGSRPAKAVVVRNGHLIGQILALSSNQRPSKWRGVVKAAFHRGEISRPRYCFAGTLKEMHMVVLGLPLSLLRNNKTPN